MPMHDQVLTFFGFSRLPFGKHLTPPIRFLPAPTRRPYPASPSASPTRTCCCSPAPSAAASRSPSPPSSPTSTPFAAVRQRIRISYHMPPMSLPETCDYIDHHTSRCGHPASIFADDAKADIHRHAGGLPRLVNALCYRSILHAAAHDIRIIDSTNVDMEISID